MYLSRLLLNPRDRALRRDLADCQQLHRTVLSGFPDVERDSSGARAALGVLHRVDYEPRRGTVALLVQSRAEPDWSRLPQGYLTDTNGAQPNPACKLVDAQYRGLREGTRLRFRLRANVTKRLKVAHRSDSDPLVGKRVELFKEEERIAWLRRKGELGGFEIVSVEIDDRVPNIRIAPEDTTTGWRRDLPPEDHSEKMRMMTFASVLFEGELRITDAERFRQALEDGVGPAKAYGFGLLSIAAAKG